MYIKEHYLLAKAQAVAHVAEAPVGVNAIEAFDINITPLTGPVLSRDNIARGFHGAGEEIMLEQLVNITFKTYLSNSGTAGTPPAFGVLLVACHCSETIVEGTSVTYAPAVTAVPVTMFYDIGNGANTQRHTISDCKGDVSLDETANQKGVLTYTMTGFYTRPATATEITPVLTSFLTGKTFDEDNVPTFEVHGFSPIVLSYSVKPGVEIKPRNLVGFKGVDFVTRKSVGSLSVLAPTLGTKNFFTSVESYNAIVTGPLSIVRGTVAGQIETITAGKVQLHNLALGEDNGREKLDMDMLLIPSAGDDEWSIAFT